MQDEANKSTESTELDTSRHFLRQWIEADLAAGKNDGTVVTRFPPEPNGWIHIGHAKAVWVDFGMAALFHGRCHLRMDDTNPSKESEDFVEQLKRDIEWLGYKPGRVENLSRRAHRTRPPLPLARPPRRGEPRALPQDARR